VAPDELFTALSPLEVSDSDAAEYVGGGTMHPYAFPALCVNVSTGRGR
jgi:hypothetical protein